MARRWLWLWAGVALIAAGTAAGDTIKVYDSRGAVLREIPIDLTRPDDPLYRALSLEAPVDSQRSELVLAGLIWSALQTDDVGDPAAQFLSQTTGIGQQIGTTRFVRRGDPNQGRTLVGTSHEISRGIRRLRQVVDLATGAAVDGPLSPPFLLNVGNRAARGALRQYTRLRSNQPGTAILNEQVDFSPFVHLAQLLHYRELLQKTRLAGQAAQIIDTKLNERVARALLRVSRQLAGLSKAPGGGLLRDELVKELARLGGRSADFPKWLDAIVSSEKVTA